MSNLIDRQAAIKVASKECYELRGVFGRIEEGLNELPTVKAIPLEQLLSILPKYDDYIHMKTYLYNETMEDIYSEGHEEGWNACLRAIKEELDYWEKENDSNDTI